MCHKCSAVIDEHARAAADYPDETIRLFGFIVRETALLRVTKRICCSKRHVVIGGLS